MYASSATLPRSISFAYTDCSKMGVIQSNRCSVLLVHTVSCVMMIGFSCSRSQGFIPCKCFEPLAGAGHSVQLGTHVIAQIASYPVIRDAPDIGWKTTHPFPCHHLDPRLSSVCLCVCLWMYPCMQMAREAAARASRPGGATGMGLLMGQYLDSRPLPGGHYLAGLAGCPRSTAHEVCVGFCAFSRCLEDESFQ